MLIRNGEKRQRPFGVRNSRCGVQNPKFGTLAVVPGAVISSSLPRHSGRGALELPPNDPGPTTSSYSVFIASIGLVRPARIAGMALPSTVTTPHAMTTAAIVCGSARFDSCEQRLQCAARAEACHDAYGNSGRGQENCPPDHRDHDVTRSGTEGNPHTQFPRARRHCEGE